MESSVGFFGQIKYIIKGIAKPRFFNRLANQSKGCMIGYMIFMTILSTAVFWGVNYLVNYVGGGINQEVRNVLAGFPDFEYNNGKLVFDDYYIYSTEDGKTSIVADSSMANMTSEYAERVEIQTDWSNGKNVAVLNTNEIGIIQSLGQVSSVAYSDIQPIFGFPNQFKKADFPKVAENVIQKIYIFCSVGTLPFFLIKTVITGFVFMGLGFGIVKIMKAQYSLKELYTMSVYITGVTTILKRAVTGSGLRIGTLWLDIIFVLIVGVYLFFSITGSAEEAGPTSTIYFNKPSSKKYGKDAGDDPFAKKNYGAGDYNSGSYQTYSAPASQPSYTTKTSYTESQPAYQSSYAETQPAYAESQPSYEETQPAYAEAQPEYTEAQPAYTEYAEQPAYNTEYTEQPTYTEYAEQQSSYTEPQTAYAEAQTYTEYAETQPAYTEPVQQEEPKSAIVKSEATYGFGYSTTAGGKKKKPKYDRPITAPDSYNGSYYGNSDDDDTEESTYFGKSLLDNRGGMYGKTLSAFTPSENKSSVISQPENPFEGINLGASVTSGSQSSLGGSLYTNTQNHSSNDSGLVFTTKNGAEPFAAQKMGFGSNDGFDNLNSKKKNTSNVGYTKSGKKINRYSPDDFAAWEREQYAEEFSKPIGGFGNR